MLKETAEPSADTPVAPLGAVRVQGADAVRFLQGQLSNDVAVLAPGQPMLAGLHNPQGRAIALLRLILVAPDDVLAVLPRELAGPVAARLSKYVLRAKAKVTDASAGWRTAVPAGTAVPPEDDHERRVQDIASGVPQVYAATSEQFVAQMLNLDVVGGISFTKGCYTGQEVIARAHYRGRVKRRMQRFRTHEAVTLSPGSAGVLEDGRSFRVVDAVSRADGRCEFLAVAPLDARKDDSAPEDAAPAGVVLKAAQLELPYALPE